MKNICSILLGTLLSVGVVGVANALQGNSASAQSSQKVVVAFPSFREGTLKLLDLIMAHSVEMYGPYEIVSGPEMNRARAENGMVEGEIDVMWGSFSQKRISRLTPVYSYVVMASPRVCIIAKGTQSRFNGITTLDAWKQKGLTTGLGRFWSDMKIYEYNNMPTESTTKSKLLYRMVENDRFDCFNRGAEEVFGNLAAHPDKALEIEKSLAFVFEGKYSGFLVTPADPQVKARIEYGIQEAWKSNAFAPIIEEYIAASKEKFKSLHLEERNFIWIKNPNAITDRNIRAINKDFIDGFFASQ